MLFFCIARIGFRTPPAVHFVPDCRPSFPGGSGPLRPGTGRFALPLPEAVEAAAVAAVAQEVAEEVAEEVAAAGAEAVAVEGGPRSSCAAPD